MSGEYVVRTYRGRRLLMMFAHSLHYSARDSVRTLEERNVQHGYAIRVATEHMLI